MTTPRSRPRVKMQAVPKFPADVIAGDGIAIEKTGATFTFSVAPNYAPSFDVPFEAGEILVADGTNSVSTIAKSSTAGQVLRVIGDGSYQWGALNLADGDAVAGVLPATNGGVGTGTSGYVLTGNGPGVPSTYQGFVQAGTDPLTRTWQEKARDNLSAKDFCACDGVTDDYAAFVKLAARASTLGADIVVPGGCKILLPITGSRTAITLYRVRVRGAGAVTRHDAGSVDMGSWFLITGTNDSPFATDLGGGIIGMTFMWPEQDDPTTPIAYPAAIRANSGFGITASSIEDNIFVNAYVAIDLGTGAGYTYVHKNKISALLAGITASTSAAETWIIDNNFSFAWGYNFYNELSELANWIARVQGHAVGVKLTGAQTDAWTISRNVFFGLKYGIHGDRTGSDGYYWGTINDNGFDACLNGIRFENRFRPAIVTITGNQFLNSAYGGASDYHIVINNSTVTTESTLSIAANNFAGSVGGHVSLAFTSGMPVTVAMTGNEFNTPGMAGGGGTFNSVLLNGNGINLTFTGNSIDGRAATTTRGISVTLASSVTVTGNTLKGLTTGIDVSGTLGSNLVVVGNNAVNVPTPVSIGGTVSGSRRLAPNSWTGNAPIVLAQSAVQVSHTGNTNETVLATITIPAGSIGPNGRVEIAPTNGNNSSGNSKTYRVRVGTSGAGTGGTQIWAASNTTNTVHNAVMGFANRNGTNSQVATVSPASATGLSGGTLTTLSLDTTAAIDVAFTGQLANAGDSVTIEAYAVILYPG